MGLPTNIKNILNPNIVEHTRIEFKESWNPESIIHTICAFANDIDNFSGGYIIIGVKEDNGKPIYPISGVNEDKIDKIEQEIVEYCNKCIEPRYLPVIEVMDYEGVKIIVLWVPAGSSRPYKSKVNIYLKNDNSKAYYIRKGSVTIKANNTDEQELFLLGGLQPFDDRPNYHANISDLDINLIRNYLKEVNSNLYKELDNMSIKEIAESMKICDGPAENLKPKNVGLLFFTYNPEKYFPYSYVELTHIPDPTGEGMIEKRFIGPLHIQYKDIMQYFKNNIIKEKVFKKPNQMEAERVYNYRYEVIDEIIGNAILHKSYQVYEPISIRINPDSIEIMSFPGIDTSISKEDIENLKLKSRKYRNKRISDFLKELHIVEAKNTGYPTILRYVKINNSPLPIIETDDKRSFVNVIIPIHKSFLTEEKVKIEDNKKIKEKVLDILEIKPMRLTEISKTLGYEKIPGSLKRILATLEEEGIIFKNYKKYTKATAIFENNEIKYKTKNNGDHVSYEAKKISIEKIKNLLKHNVSIEYYETIDSTNLYLKSIANDVDKDMVVIANHQTGGKGRLGRTFVSNNDSGIYMSILFKKQYQKNIVSKMTCIACVATALAIEKVAGVNTQIKWVNDIYLNNKKVCGILTESKINKEKFEYIIVGIGINAYKQDFGIDVNNIATTIEDETNVTISRNDLIVEIINNLLNLLDNANNEYIYNEYKSRLFVIGKTAEFQIGDSLIEGVIVDLNKDYNLIVDFNGVRKEVFSGEITRMRLS